MPFINDQIISHDRVAAKAKIEDTYGVAPVMGIADGVMMKNFKITPIEATHEDSNIVSGVAGNSNKTLNNIMRKVTFDLELGRAAGDTTAIPAFGMFLRVSGWDEFVEADHVRYQVAADINLQDSLAFETQLDDRIYLMTGCRGSCVIKWMEDKRLEASFSLEGIYHTPTQAVFARVDYSAFARSLLINPDNITLCTQKGSDVVTHSVEYDTGAQAARIPSVNQQLIAHTALTPSLKSTIRMPKLAQWNIEQDIENETEDWIKLALGTTAGSIIEMDFYQQFINVDFTDETPRKANITHHPIPDATTTGAVIRVR